MKKYTYITYIVLFFLIYLPIGKMSAVNTTTKFTVVIDPGHGGNDPGAIGRRGKEKNINLAVALKLGKFIEQSCKDTRVVYTRKTDVFIPLHRRAEIANNAKADLFISIHTNSLANRRSNIIGTETYTLGLHRTKDNLEVAKKENAVILIEDNYKQQYAGFNPNSSESYIIFEFMQDQNLSQSVNFASAIQREFKKSRRVDRGVHQAGFLVLRATSMPSVLIELGYISNAHEEQYLLSDKGSTTLARSIYNAFLSYKDQNSQTAKEHSSSVEVRKEEPVKTRSNSVSGYPKSTRAQNTSAQKTADRPKQNNLKEQPVFKIQILTANKLLPANSRLFKGLRPVDHYKENGIFKYTYGSSTDYNHIRRMKLNQVDRRFKDAFIIALKDGKKVNVHQAIVEFKHNRK